MTLNDIFNDVRSSFNGIWQTKERGNSLEIITPYATTNNRFISVFLTIQGKDFIISDGGWINSGVYDLFPQNEEPSFLKVFFHYQSAFSILETESGDGLIYYYLKASNAVDVPSKIFDLALFLQNIVSLSEINFESKLEKETRLVFISRANDFLRSFVDSDRIKFNRYLDPQRKEVRFNAIYNNSQNKLTLVNYITGSTTAYFSSSIFRTNQLYEMAEESTYKDFISDKITVIDNTAGGFVPTKISNFLYHLETHTATKIINWSERERLQMLLN